MRTARPLGLSPDGSTLIVVLDGGEQVAIPADDRLRAALRNDRARMGQLEIEMESALRPRDIQARIRAGESLEAVAQAAGVPPEQIEPFAAPVIAEREHIAGLAQSNPVRRAGDAVAHRSLRAVVTDRLLSVASTPTRSTGTPGAVASGTGRCAWVTSLVRRTARPTSTTTKPDGSRSPPTKTPGG